MSQGVWGHVQWRVERGWGEDEEERVRGWGVVQAQHVHSPTSLGFGAGDLDLVLSLDFSLVEVVGEEDVGGTS